MTLKIDFFHHPVETNNWDIDHYYARSIRLGLIGSLLLIIVIFILLPKEFVLRPYTLRTGVEKLIQEIQLKLNDLAEPPIVERPKIPIPAVSLNEVEAATIAKTVLDEITKPPEQTEVPIISFWKVEVKPAIKFLPQVTYPEIAEMQARAIIEAAINVNKEGMNVVPEIMIPLVGEVKELKYVKDVVVKTADAIIKEAGVNLEYKVGTMIEVPRAAVTADEIATEAEFFSFGTNDLTQMTFGFSRDDAGKFLNDYYDKKIFESDPFAKLDQTGVGKLVKMAVELGKKTRPDIKLGICGEHGGDGAP